MMDFFDSTWRFVCSFFVFVISLILSVRVGRLFAVRHKWMFAPVFIFLRLSILGTSRTNRVINQ
jgi:hypothetical protein